MLGEPGDILAYLGAHMGVAGPDGLESQFPAEAQRGAVGLRRGAAVEDLYPVESTDPVQIFLQSPIVVAEGMAGDTEPAGTVDLILSLIHISRSRGLITDFGKFMDPLADKMLVMAAMLWFVEMGRMPAWALLIVVVREFAVSGLRLLAVDNGRVIAAAWSGKVKTASTMVGICLMLLPVPGWVDTTVTAVIVVTTVYSGIEYFVKNKDVIDWSNV